jgi:tetratricopeptide (TPR) repeat protein
MPYLALFSAIGWRLFISLFKTPTVQKLMVGMMSILFVFPIYAMAHYHPVQNTYFNELIGGMRGAFGEFEIDMDGNSLRPATEWFKDYCAANNISDITLASNHGGLSISQYFNPLLVKGNIVWLSLGQTYLKNWDYAILTSRTLSKFELNRGQWPPKGTIYSFEIDGIAISSVVKREDKSLQYGTKALKARNFDVALSNFLIAREKYPDMEMPHRMLGMTYMQMEKYDLAERCFDKALTLNPSNVFLLHYIGELSYYQGKLDKALLYLKKSLEMRIDNYRSEYLIANIYIRNGKFDEARDLYEKLLLRKPLSSNDRSLILAGYGEYFVVMALRENENKQTLMNKAIELFEESINTNNKNQMAYQNLINLYVHIGREDFAEQTRQIMIRNCGIQTTNNE